MTQEELNNIKTEINKAITHIARGVVSKEEVTQILKEMYTPKDAFVVVTWPECQELMDVEGWEENSHLINDDKGVDEYGSSAYFVNTKWLSNVA